MEKIIQIFETREGKCPFLEWLLTLRDIKARAIIRARIERIRFGNLGDCKSVGKGVYELRVHFGAGYRIYLGKDGLKTVILLCGGDKGTQKRDIARAILLWMEYNYGTQKLSK